ncbi:MAG: EAL domain-containing protein [Burkholderiales bacterium]
MARPVTKTALYVALTLSLLALAVFTPRAWSIDQESHTFLEITATLFAFMAGAMALAHYYSKPDNIFLLIGTGFIATGFLDGYHAVVTSDYLARFFPSTTPSLIAWGWLVSRIFLSAFLYLSWRATKIERRLRPLVVYLLTAALALGCYLLIALFTLPTAQFRSMVLSRPQELVPVLFFVLALAGYWRRGNWKQQSFEHWLILALVTSVAGQVFFMPFSARVFDTEFILAHAAKLLSYAFILIGLFVSTLQLFKRAVSNAEATHRISRLYTMLGETSQAIVRIGERDKLFREICRIAVQHGNFDLAWIGLIDEKNRRLIPTASAGAAVAFVEDLQISLDPEHPRGRGPAGIAARTGEPQVCNDLFTDPVTLPWRTALTATGLRSTASFVFRQDGKIIGVLGLYAAEKDYFEPQLVELLEEIARDISFALDTIVNEARRLHAEESILQTEARLEQMVEHLPTGAAYLEGEQLSVNRAMEQITGYARHEIGNLDLWFEKIHGKNASQARAAYEKHRQSGFEIPLRDLIQRKDGAQRLIEFSGYRDARGEVWMLNDITERWRAEDALRASEAEMRLVTDNVPAYIAFYDSELKVRFANQGFAELYGFGTGTIIGKHVSEIVPTPVLELVIPHLHEALSGRTVTYQRLHHSGENPVLHFETILIPQANPDGAVTGIFVLINNITEHINAQDIITTHLFYQSVISEFGQYALSCSSLDTLLQEAAEIAARGLDVTHSIIDELLPDGKSLITRAGEGWDPAVYGRITADAGAHQSFSSYTLHCGTPVIVDDLRTETRFTMHPTAQHLLSGVMVPIPTHGKPFGVLGAGSNTVLRKFSKEDINFLQTISTIMAAAIDRLKSEQQMEKLAQFDTLTGLPNRRLFRDRLQQALPRAKRNKQLLGLLFLDLDRFKEINDTLGHEIGDKLLQAVSKRLKACLREGDTVARLGGDEFTIILEGLNDTEQAATVPQKILDSLALPILIGNHEIYASTSIGITLYPLDDSDIDNLIKHADTAMYHAKEQGRNNYQFYRSDMGADALERMNLSNRLRHALQYEQFLLYYQPQINLKTGKIEGVEALLRWKDTELGLVTPDKFIALAEQTGMIVSIGEWVLRTVCAQYLEWKKIGLTPLRVAINLSARQFKKGDLYNLIAGALEAYAVPPHELELEITEGLLMENPQNSSAQLSQMKTLGTQIAIDDFGTGYSSLSYLKHFPLDTLKIDQSFVRDIARDPDGAAIVKAMIGLAQNLQLETVAEGVETEEQLTFLRESGCERAQGYLFSRPLPAAEITALLMEKHTFKTTRLRKTTPRPRITRSG